MSLDDDAIGSITLEQIVTFAGGVFAAGVIGLAVKYGAPYIRSWFDALWSFAGACGEYVKNWWNEMFEEEAKQSPRTAPSQPARTFYRNDIDSNSEQPIFSKPPEPKYYRRDVTDEDMHSDSDDEPGNNISGLARRVALEQKEDEERAAKYKTKDDLYKCGLENVFPIDDLVLRMRFGVKQPESPKKSAATQCSLIFTKEALPVPVQRASSLAAKLQQPSSVATK